LALYNKIYTHISTVNAITTHTSARIYPLLLPQGIAAAFPAVCYSRVSSERVYSLTGYSTLEEARIQIDSWATTYEIVKDLAGDVKTAMDAATAFHSRLESDQDFYNDESETYRVSQDYIIWNRE